MNRIDKLLQQRETLDKRIKELSAKENSAKRKEDTRRKVIIGSWVLENRKNLVKEIIENLVRDQDKAAFLNFKIEENSSSIKVESDKND